MTKNKNKWFLKGGRGSGRTVRLLCEVYENKIAELERKLEQTEKALSDYQFNYPTIKELQKENAELKNRDCWKSCEYANPKAELIEQHLKDVQNLAKAKDIIKDYIIVTKGDHCTVCGVPEENRSINVLKLNEQAEQFLKEIE